MQYRHQFSGDDELLETGGTFEAGEHFKYLNGALLALWDSEGFQVTRDWMDKIIFEGMHPRAADADIEARNASIAAREKNARVLAALIKQNTRPGAGSRTVESPPLSELSGMPVPVPDPSTVRSSASTSLAPTPSAVAADQISAHGTSVRSASALSSSSGRRRIVPLSAPADPSPTADDNAVDINNGRFAEMHLGEDNEDNEDDEDVIEPEVACDPPPKKAPPKPVLRKSSRKAPETAVAAGAGTAGNKQRPRGQAGKSR